MFGSCEDLGFEENQSELQVRIYPNPTNGMTTCILENNLELGRFELADPLG
jgi:hypothetical protein